jgi:sugar transferase (PEP-CTERM system associated)
MAALVPAQLAGEPSWHDGNSRIVEPAMLTGGVVIRIFSHYVSKTAFILLMLEMTILLMSASLVSAYWLSEAPFQAQRRVSPLLFALVILFSMSALGMYQHSAREGMRATLVRIMPSFALGFALLSALIALLPEMTIGHGASLVFGLGALGVLLARLVVFQTARSTLLEGRVIFLGGGALARECIELAERKQGFNQLTVVGCVAVSGEDSCVPEARLLQSGASLLAIARHAEATEIVVTVSNRRLQAFPVDQLLDCALEGYKISDAATFFEREACQIRLDSLHPSYLIFGGGFDQGFLRAASKRLFDLAASIAVTTLSLPLMLIAGLCIKLEDGGPVFYQQERVGKDGKLFKVLKLRSMGSDAEKGGTPTWAAANDPRVTRVGKVIRALRIDELPQMFNVLLGDMSFVGPRPERAYFVGKLNDEVPYYNVRHGIKPGVTGLAQVRYQYGASVADAVEKLQYDLYYVKNNSLFLDVLILIDTVQVVLTGRGSR